MQEKPPSREAADAAALIPEFVALNRRRAHGDPPLDLRELARWLELRQRLERELSPLPEGVDPGRRQTLRVPTHLKVQFRHASDDRTDVASDISEDGLFLATDRPLPPGTPLCLELAGLDDDSEPLRLEGVVVWVREEPASDGPAGMGVRFTHLDEVQRQAVLFLVERALNAL